MNSLLKKIKKPTLSRRTLLDAGVSLSWMVPLGMSLGALLGFLRYEPPSTLSTKFVLGEAGSLPSLPSYMTSGQVWLHKDDRGYFAVSAICTHLGCTIRREGQDQGYVCRCHGSRFDEEGQVTNGPAEKPLHFKRLSWNSSNQLVVDIGAEVDADFRLASA